jgi:hypothetical protein
MPSSPTERPKNAPDNIVAIARRLCGQDVVSAQACGGGGNNRVYRIQTREETFALKFYGSADLDDRDRLGHEFDALRFLKDRGIGNALPRAFAVDRAARCALYEWIEGTAPSGRSLAEIGEILELLAMIHETRNAKGASELPPATEAVLRLSDLLEQIEGRLARLATATPSEPELASFLRDDLRPELDRRVAALFSWDLNASLPQAQRTLSPSDFGFHNALRGPAGSLVFIDFEYFGWDDPAKLSADFLWHPAMDLSFLERAEFLSGVTRLYGDDPNFSKRFAVSYPLYGIRWVLIILNEFLPKLWTRRVFSGGGGDWDAAKREQLAKARAKLAALRLYTEGQFS